MVWKDIPAFHQADENIHNGLLQQLELTCKTAEYGLSHSYKLQGI